MAQGPDDIQPGVEEKPDEIREQMEETRSSLTEKLETLEGRVFGTVEAVQSTVEQTVENVKETVQDTVQAVKRTFDVRRHVHEHPWMMFGGSVLAGFVVGSVVGQDRRYVRRPARYYAYGGGNGVARAAALPRTGEEHYRPAPEPESPGFLAGLTDKFGDELKMLKGTAVGALTGILRDLLVQSVPNLAPQVNEFMNSLTTKLGGEPIRGPVIPPSPERPTQPPVHANGGTGL